METAIFLDPSYRIMRGQGEKNLIDRSKQNNSRTVVFKMKCGGQKKFPPQKISYHSLV